MLNLLYVLLALSIVISLFGIVNTLVLTRLRADARARNAARGRDDAPAGAPDDPPREHRHALIGAVLGHRARHLPRRR